MARWTATVSEPFINRTMNGAQPPLHTTGRSRIPTATFAPDTRIGTSIGAGGSPGAHDVPPRDAAVRHCGWSLSNRRETVWKMETTRSGIDGASGTTDVPGKNTTVLPVVSWIVTDA